MKKKGVIILIVVLVIALIVETILLISKKVGTVPTLKNGEEVLIEFKSGTKYSIDDIWNTVKDQYALSTVIDKIDETILEEKYKKSEDVEKYVQNSEITLKNNYVDENGNFDEAAMLSALTNYGYADLDAYLKGVKLNYMRTLATEEYSKTIITDKEINDYYKNEAVGDIEAHHVLVRSASTSTEDLEKAKTKAEEILKDIKADIKSGTDKLEALKKYNTSEDDVILYQSLGYFNKGDMEEPFETAAYKLKKNELSNEVVKTSYGYHIILVTDKKEKDTLDNLREEIIEKLAEEKRTEDTTLQVKALEALREEAGVKINDSSLQERYNRYINNQLNANRNAN